MVENCNFLKNCPILKIDKNQKKCKKFQILNLTPTFDSRFRISMKFSIRKYLHLLSDQPKQVSYPCWLVWALNQYYLAFFHPPKNQKVSTQIGSFYSSFIQHKSWTFWTPSTFDFIFSVSLQRFLHKIKIGFQGAKWKGTVGMDRF